MFVNKCPIRDASIFTKINLSPTMDNKFSTKFKINEINFYSIHWTIKYFLNLVISI